MASYHLRDLEEVTDERTLFSSVNNLAEVWYRAGHAVQDEVIEQLTGYRETLDVPHRQRLDQHIASGREVTKGTPAQYFWDALP